MQCRVHISVLSVTLRNTTEAVHMHDHKVEMESDAQGRRLTIVTVPALVYGMAKNNYPLIFVN